MQPHREACRRHHRLLGHYLAVTAWRRGLDCIVLERTDVEKLLGVKKIRPERIEWLRDDLKPWFKHQQWFYRRGVKASSLWLSRSPLDKHLPTGTMTTKRRIALMSSGPKTQQLRHSKGAKTPTISDIVSTLALLSAGIRTP